jgi:hypothetical protein
MQVRHSSCIKSARRTLTEPQPDFLINDEHMLWGEYRKRERLEVVCANQET